MRRLLFCLTLLAALLYAVPTYAQTADVTTTRWDVFITINADSTLRVREEHSIEFGDEAFTSGARSLAIRDFDALDNIVVYEGDVAYTETKSGEPGTFFWELSGPFVQINWFFEPTSNGTRTFAVEYTVLGAADLEHERINRFAWDAVPTDHRTPIESSSVVLNLPPGSRVERDPAPTTYGPEADINVLDDILVFNAGEIPLGDGFRVEVYYQLDPDFEIQEEGSSIASEMGIGSQVLVGLEIFMVVVLVTAIVVVARRRRDWQKGTQADVPPDDDT